MKALTPQDLMIGDWVTVNGKPKQIEYIDKLCSYNKTEPIPLTKEIVEKNGFQRHPDYDYDRDEVYRLFVGEEDDGEDYVKYYSIEICLKNSRIRIRRHIYPIPDTEFMGIIRYVHEMQHAMRVCKINQKLIIL